MPACNTNEMQALNFEKIDFTEYTQDLTLDMKELKPSEIEATVVNEMKNL